jgi:hypothetical protein
MSSHNVAFYGNDSGRNGLIGPATTLVSFAQKYPSNRDDSFRIHRFLHYVLLGVLNHSVGCCCSRLAVMMLMMALAAVRSHELFFWGHSAR